MRRVDRLSGAGEVAIKAFVVTKPVVNRIIDSPKRDCGPQLVAFDRVVKNYVKDYFDPGLMKGPDHLLELEHLRTRLLHASV